MPSITVVVEERAKLAPRFPPRFAALAIPFVAAIDFVTAFPRVFATAFPTVFPVLFPNVLAVPDAIVFVAVSPNVSDILLFQLWLYPPLICKGKTFSPTPTATASPLLFVFEIAEFSPWESDIFWLSVIDWFSVWLSLSEAVSVFAIFSVVSLLSVIDWFTPFCTPALTPTLTPTVAEELTLLFSLLWKFVDQAAYGAIPE